MDATTVISPVGNRCPTCGLNMPYPPCEYNICPCCGTEFGLDDDMYSYRELRNQWLEAGAQWFSNVPPHTRPVNWDPYEQLALAGYDYDARRPVASVGTTYAKSSQLGHFASRFWIQDSDVVKAA